MTDREVMRGVALPGAGDACEISIEHGRISDIRETPGVHAATLALPAFADLHLHADRAYTYSGSRPGSLAEAIASARELRRRQQREEVRRRAARLLATAGSKGTLRARSHVDIDGDVGLRALEGVLEAGADSEQFIDLEVVAFATDRLDPDTVAGRRLLSDAVGTGATLVGAAPARYPDPRASIGTVLDLALELGVDVDLHLDESSSGKGMLLDHLAEATLERGLNRRVTASHCCELACVPNEVATRAISRVAEAELTVIALPALNLYLQDRGDSSPRRRGLTAVRELAAAGVTVLIGSDNVEDAFYPYGTADPLESAFLLSIAGQVDADELLVSAICGGKGELVVGDHADMVLVEAASLREALADRARPRAVLRRGVELRPTIDSE